MIDFWTRFWSHIQFFIFLFPLSRFIRSCRDGRFIHFDWTESAFFCFDLFLSLPVCFYMLISRTGNKIKTNHNEIDTHRHKPNDLSQLHRLGVEIGGIGYICVHFHFQPITFVKHWLRYLIVVRSFARFLNFIRFVSIIWITFQDKIQKSHTSNRPVLTSSLFLCVLSSFVSLALLCSL